MIFSGKFWEFSELKEKDLEYYLDASPNSQGHIIGRAFHFFPEIKLSELSPNTFSWVRIRVIQQVRKHAESRGIDISGWCHHTVLKDHLIKEIYHEGECPRSMLNERRPVDPFMVVQVEETQRKFRSRIEEYTQKFRKATRGDLS